MRKKALVFVLLVVVSLGLLSGCNTPGSDPETGTTTNAADTDVTSSENSESESTEETARPADQSIYQPDLSSVDLPIVYLSDFENAEVSVADLVKDDGEIELAFSFVSNRDSIESFDCTAKIKVQGATSAKFPKKNFNIKLYTDDTFEDKNKVDFGWGKQNKYCMKANWVDFSQARNVIGGKMFAQVVDSRTNVNPGLVRAPNNGAVDGFPILVYVNGNFHGIYTMNIPKDEWMFAMDGDETTKQAMLMADAWTEPTYLNQEIGEGDFEDHGFELEYCSTEDIDTQWVKDSFNELISLLNCGDDELIRQELPKHLDIEAGIDNMLFTYFIDARDNVAKNILWVTYDGEVWIPSMYDMDGTYGISWSGEPETSHRYPKFAEDGSISAPGCKMYYVLLTVFADEVEARYNFLREDILTAENTKSYFDAFYSQVPMAAYDADRARWINEPAKYQPFYYDNLTNYEEAINAQLNRLDSFFEAFND